jgi:hypothetical protein
VEQLLDREEALAFQRISEALRHAGEGLLEATDLRGKIRRHPFLAAGLGAGLGFFGGSFVLRALKRVVSATSGIPIPGARPPYALPGILIESLRGVRGQP